ncbi:PREDICTED: uncharacterized protein LOC109157010 [Ipomoea nil]|uniref:uncharacterized protein LOC109157010 n=1 Tax=Ipomoea nil TaxID=35883 RepID=UPI000901D5BD|nr:PREDICTED: uncharacterized protein LOC109157010 [Ipomoea nil]
MWTWWRQSPCMVNGKCSKHFPKKFSEFSSFDQDGYPIYRRRDDGMTINKNGIHLDNRYVVPHNRYLLLKYRAQLNVEWCNQSRSIKYLFKYVNKGNDRVTAEFYKSTIDNCGNEVIDEINMYYDCRYVSSCEATWRLFSFDVQFRTPAVERLSFHLPDCETVVFADDDAIEDVLRRHTVGQSMFNEWFEANKKYAEARLLTNIEMPIRGPMSFKDIRSFNGVEYVTFRDACYARGLLDDDKEYIDAIKEASQWSSAHPMRKLFVTLLMFNSLNRPENVWNEVWVYLAEDAQITLRRVLSQPDLILTDDEKKNFGLLEIEKLLQIHNKSLKEFPPMPIPALDNSRLSVNRLLFEELSYNREELANEAYNLTMKFTDEQRSVYETIIGDVASNAGGLFFVYGYGGTGKTFLWRALSATLRSNGDVVLNVASSGIASLLLPGGRTAHSRFAIPININEDSTCNITPGSDLAELIVRAKLIIWDEAPMMHKHCFEALDRTMRDLLRFSNHTSASNTFGGKTVVLGGDFRQILPVVPKGTRQDIVGASINSSYLWNSCRVLKLTKNLRLSNMEHGIEQQEVEQFARWIASIGDGTVGCANEDCPEIDIPQNLLLQSTGDPIATIVDNTFPMFKEGDHDTSFIENQAILAPTLDVVNSINDYMSDMHTAESKTFFSYDSVCRTETSNGILADVHTLEFLNGLRASGIPNHALTLKIGSPVMLLRNIDHSLGLCNGTRSKIAIQIH